jgi:glycosyltransferase involved in cell wall biosynthesis
MVRMIPSPSDSPASVLVLEPWLGGSHAAFLAGLQNHSKHTLDVCGLADRHWKWRMRGGAWQIARELEGRALPDLILATDYLDLPGFLGFMPGAWSAIPSVLYFHENQLTYPVHGEGKTPDTSYGFTNVLSAIRAQRVLFNSKFHQREFTNAGAEFLRHLPKPNPLTEFQSSMESARVVSPGVDVDAIALGAGNPGGPLRILFPHRWEHDKNPLQFLQVLVGLQERCAEFELVLLGEQYIHFPPGVEEHLERLRPRIAHQGFLEDAAAYRALLGSCDVLVSTADHEFFGVAVVEGLAAGVTPLLPNRLSYPEVLGEGHAQHLYRSESELSQRLLACALDPAPLRDQNCRRQLRERAAKWSVQHCANQFDESIRDLLPPT